MDTNTNQFIDYIKLLELLICMEFSAIKLAAFSQSYGHLLDLDLDNLSRDLWL